MWLMLRETVIPATVKDIFLCLSSMNHKEKNGNRMAVDVSIPPLPDSN